MLINLIACLVCFAAGLLLMFQFMLSGLNLYLYGAYKKESE